jgi:hypothetical protein
MEREFCFAVVQKKGRPLFVIVIILVMCERREGWERKEVDRKEEFLTSRKNDSLLILLIKFFLN